VLLDPPYGDATLVPALQRLAEPGAGWLTREAVVVAKHFWRDAPPARVGALVHRRDRRIGETALTFYTLEEPPA
jgi:16S rRNA G966 N2-methylase RsmD